MSITLTRYYTPHATWGEFAMADFNCCTIELPWRDNLRRVSCIPEGEYALKMRTSPVVSRSSGGEFQRGWEVTDVEGRDFIMIHPGNWARNVLGCIAVGREHVILQGALAVSSSRDTFRDLMAVLSERDEWRLSIVGFRP